MTPLRLIFLAVLSLVLGCSDGPGPDGAIPRMMPLRSVPLQLMKSEDPAQRRTSTTGITTPLMSSGINSTSITSSTSTTNSSGMVSSLWTSGVSSMSTCATVAPTVTAASPPVCVNPPGGVTPTV